MINGKIELMFIKTLQNVGEGLRAFPPQSLTGVHIGTPLQNIMKWSENYAD
jgi:hypothetical protein